MSGRSAYVRKKITETKALEKNAATTGKSSNAPKSPDGLDYNNVGLGEYPSGTGYGTTNARFLKFSDPVQETGLNYQTGSVAMSTHSIESHSTGSDTGHGDGGGARPMDDFAYARVRKPVIKTEDVSGIERSGFRSAIDKRSDDVRRGLSKAFSFGKKSKKVEGADFRPPTVAATHRPNELEYLDSEYADTMHSPISNAAQATKWDTDSNLPPPPSAKLPPLPPNAALAVPIKRWTGAGRPVQRWNKLRKDPELWDPNGDVFVYLGRRDQSPRPQPSFRLSSHIIEATESRLLVQLLRESSTEEDIHLPLSPVGAPPMLSRHGLNQGRNNQLASSASGDADVDGQISYEIFFPTPPELTKLEALRYNITTRNVFALLYHASLVGLSLCQALTDLHTRLDVYMPPEADNVGTLLNYLSARGIDDPRNDPELSVSLLAWSEAPVVRWEEGWHEAFVHAAGMYSKLEQCADFKRITPITRALLERASLETQLRVQEAEKRLAEFSDDEIWPVGGTVSRSPARAASDRLQQFFLAYFKDLYGQWPPPASGAQNSDGEDVWLTRTMARRLQKDFGALYDYLVNRDIVWDESETRSSRKWMMISAGGNRAFEADTEGMPITDLLIEYDNHLRLPHIPHPFPLLPEPTPVTSPHSAQGRDRLKKADKEKAKATEDRALERRMQLAYSEATNIYLLGSDFVQSDLVESFVKFEKSDHISTIDPSAARRGRWVLIYAVLQVLASVSVDSPRMRYKDDVSYHLSPQPKGVKIPPWKGASSAMTAPHEGFHELSHCWVVPQTWVENNGNGNDGSISPNDETADMLKMMRAQVLHLPPPPPGGSARRTSNGGWHTPATTRSPPSTMWGGSSAMSTASDDASSVRTPASLYRTQSRDGLRGGARGAAVNNNNNNNNYYGVSLSEEPRSIYSAAVTASRPSDALPRGVGVSRGSNTGVGEGSAHMPPPPTNGASFAGSGGFLNLDESPPPVRRKKNTLEQSSHRGEAGMDGLNSLTPVIRDFDYLDVIDDHEP